MVLKRRPSKITVCYLCGQPLGQRQIDKDHVPPDRWIARSFRSQAPGVVLLTLPVHETCQDAYEDDEVYFFNTLLPLAAGSIAADAALKELGESFKRPQQKSLGLRVLNEFGKVITNDGLLVKSYIPFRVNRVVWKVVRGLFFVEYDRRVLPESTPRMFQIFGPAEAPDKPPPEFALVRDTESRGRYQGAFDYKYIVVDDPTCKLHYWALLLWDRIAVIVAFHDPDCSCEKCRKYRDTIDVRSARRQ